MFIIPTGLLREKSIATMIYTVSTEIIEKILSREMKVTDFDYMIFTWQDAFIIELLKWFDKKINEIPERKINLLDPDNAIIKDSCQILLNNTIPKNEKQQYYNQFAIIDYEKDILVNGPIFDDIFTSFFSIILSFLN